jgi:hypothetical protein
MRSLAIAGLASCALTTSALIFPQTGTVYDPLQNVIQLNNPIIPEGYGLFDGSNGRWSAVALTPTWIVTAGHTYAPDNIFTDRFGGEHQTVPNSAIQINGIGGFTLVKLQTSAPEYGKIRRSTVTIGETLKILGRGRTGGSPVVYNGTTRAWTWGNADSFLRWGSAPVESVGSDRINWTFDSTYGPNVCAMADQDSSTPCFINNELVGVVNTTSFWTGYINGVCETFSVFSPFMIDRCPPYDPGIPLSQNVTPTPCNTISIAPVLSTIFSTIAVRMAATDQEGPAWDPLQSNAGGATSSTTSSIDASGIVNPAPQNVYKKIKLVTDGNGGPTYIGWSTTNLNRHLTYKVRVHLSSVPAPDIYTPFDVVQKVTVTDANGSYVFSNIRPYNNGYYKATVVEFNTPLTPNSLNEIYGSVSVDTANFGINAVISGVEVIPLP